MSEVPLHDPHYCTHELLPTSVGARGRRRVGSDDFGKTLVVCEVLGCAPRCVFRRHVAPESGPLIRNRPP